jgi:hypothetical protein
MVIELTQAKIDMIKDKKNNIRTSVTVFVLQPGHWESDEKKKWEKSRKIFEEIMDEIFLECQENHITIDMLMTNESKKSLKQLEK